MKLPAEITDAVVKAAGRELALMVKAEIADAQLLTIDQVAEMLKVSRPTARKIVGEIIDLGVQSPRIEFSKIKQLIAKRRVPA